ncbi:hypothetical protein SAMN04488505_10947 [Chitinophaga rupis]|uniref:Uncharacterized protein n=2 Tax=Chitinophaga rupis TaxID=573321 RepID=A0A1H8EVY6_9BACT|nr:hypothetical protein SAMN04488505_10947 [Chitinophaga rupis]
MGILITYDLVEKHEVIKTAMIQMGYSKVLKWQTTLIYLPNTALYHESSTPQQAIADLKTACAKVGLYEGPGLERAFAVTFDNINDYTWEAIPGKPFGS